MEQQTKIDAVEIKEGLEAGKWKAIAWVVIGPMGKKVSMPRTIMQTQEGAVKAATQWVRDTLRRKR